MLLTRQEYEEFIATANLSSKEVRQQINSIVLDEVKKTKWVTSSSKPNGCAPIDTSGNRYLRPCPQTLFDAQGWRVAIFDKWFDD